MAQTKKKRRTKHRGTQAGTIESRGRTGRPTSRAQARQQALQQRQNKRVDRATAEPTWRGASIRAGIAAAVFFLFLMIMNQPTASSIFIGIAMFGLYVPIGYYTDRFLYQRRMRKDAEQRQRAAQDKAAGKAAE
jgi:UDP-N-acetylmuramyl pentapeptide phosphotransferase/UDP-N-acetylglucosamine-1-phosphate transferase